MTGYGVTSFPAKFFKREKRLLFSRKIEKGEGRHPPRSENREKPAYCLGLLRRSLL